MIYFILGFISGILILFILIYFTSKNIAVNFVKQIHKNTAGPQGEVLQDEDYETLEKFFNNYEQKNINK